MYMKSLGVPFCGLRIKINEYLWELYHHIECCDTYVCIKPIVDDNKVIAFILITRNTIFGNYKAEGNQIILWSEFQSISVVSLEEWLLQRSWISYNNFSLPRFLIFTYLPLFFMHFSEPIKIKFNLR